MNIIKASQQQRRGWSVDNPYNSKEQQLSLILSGNDRIGNSNWSSPIRLPIFPCPNGCSLRLSLQKGLSRMKPIPRNASSGDELIWPKELKH
mmetsp:Transcript_21270/g.39867  ORF Transcript_21270/g.39867 Transcript_21270/m.39867 type:complete len:92 (+) Transcript_21270:330-605(+)